MPTRTTDLPDDANRTDLSTPSPEGYTRWVRIVPGYGTSWLTVTLNPRCPTCGQPMPKEEG